MAYETGEPITKPKSNLQNQSLEYGISVYEFVNLKYAKLTFKVNGVGNLTLECSPSLTPGTLPLGVEPGKVPKGTKIFDYDNGEIIYSITFDDCVNISNFAKSRYDFDEKTGKLIDPAKIAPVCIYRNSKRFNKQMNISYVKGMNGYYVSMNFQSTDTTGKTHKFQCPISLTNLDMLAKVFESYANNYFMIKYYNSVEKEKHNILNEIATALGIKGKESEKENVNQD